MVWEANMGPILIDFLLFLSGLGSQRGTKKRVAVQLGAHVFLGDTCIWTWKDFQKVSLYAGVDVQDSAYAPTSQHEARRGGIFLSGRDPPLLVGATPPPLQEPYTAATQTLQIGLEMTCLI